MGLDEPVNLMDLAPSQPKTPEEYFSSVRHTPGMWAVNPRFSDACALVTGFFEGRGGWPMPASFTLWLADRFGGEENVFWGCHVLWIALPTRGSWYDQSSLSPDDDAATIDKLFELLLAWADETDMGLKRDPVV